MAEELFDRPVDRRDIFTLGVSVVTSAFFSQPLYSDQASVDSQPFCALVRRLVEAMEYPGSPFTNKDLGTIRAALTRPGDPEAVAVIQSTLDLYPLVHVTLNPERRVSAIEGAAVPELVQNGSISARLRRRWIFTAWVCSSTPPVHHWQQGCEQVGLLRRLRWIIEFGPHPCREPHSWVIGVRPQKPTLQQ
jgi:hypothetical protein